MAELGNDNPAVNPSQGRSQEVGERMASLEKQLSELATLVSSQSHPTVRVAPSAPNSLWAIEFLM